MYLKENEGEAFFEKYGIPVPRGFVSISAAEAVRKAGAFAKDFKMKDFLLKALLHSGKRGKSGAVIATDLKNLRKKFSGLMKKSFGGEKVKEILVVEKIGIKRELYLSVSLDRFKRCPVLVFSGKGGMEIEEISKKRSREIKKLELSGGGNSADFQGAPGSFYLPGSSGEKKLLSFVAGLGLAKKLQPKITGIIKKLLELYNKEDCLLAEINPLILDKKDNFYAADAKVVTDAEALFRHPQRQKESLRGFSPLEKRAHRDGLAFVELDGDVAVIGNGAGLVMSTLDMVKAAGVNPANFCDVGGGASSLMMEEAMKIVLAKKKLKVLFINIFGGITRCDEIAAGLIDFLKKNKVITPIVIRLTGTNEAEAHRMLKRHKIEALASFSAAVQALSKLYNK